MYSITVVVILLAYLSLFAELVLLHVPSVASVYQLVFSKKSIINFNKETLSNCTLINVLHWPLYKKIVLLALPTFISILTGLLPLILVTLIYFDETSWLQLNNISTAQNITGIALIIAGRLLTLYSTVVIRKDNRQQQDSFQLKTNSVFAYSRNPLLLGMYIMYAGMLVIFPVPVFAFGLLVYFANMHFRVLLEEDFLVHQFGNTFIQYMQKTRRYC